MLYSVCSNASISFMSIEIQCLFLFLHISTPVSVYFSPPSIMWTDCQIISGCVSVRNFTIRFMPIPIIDASQALKASPEKTEDALLKVCKQFPSGLHLSRKNVTGFCIKSWKQMVTTISGRIKLNKLINNVIHHYTFDLLSWRHRCVSSTDWKLSVQEPWNQEIPTGTGLSASTGHRNHNYTTGV